MATLRIQQIEKELKKAEKIVENQITGLADAMKKLSDLETLHLELALDDEVGPADISYMVEWLSAKLEDRLVKII